VGTIGNILGMVILLILYALIAIGPFQVIMALIRAALMKNWDTNFGQRLKTYFKMLAGYWIAAGLVYLLTFVNQEFAKLFFVFVPFLCSVLAVYYWRAVYLLYKEKRIESKV